jgi:F-type H+-transporting ATPase subunit b
MASRRISLGRLGTALAAALLAAGPALAQEGGGGGMPQLNAANYPPVLVWLAILFVFLYVVMARVTLPRIGAALQLRADRIKGDLDRAASLKEETERIVAAYEKARTEARNQAAAVSRDTAAALAHKAAERQTKVSADLAARIKSAEDNIQAARDRAMGEIRNVAADIATDAARRLVGLTVAPADAQQAVAAVLKERA